MKNLFEGGNLSSYMNKPIDAPQNGIEPREDLDNETEIKIIEAQKLLSTQYLAGLTDGELDLLGEKIYEAQQFLHQQGVERIH